MEVRSPFGGGESQQPLDSRAGKQQQDRDSPHLVWKEMEGWEVTEGFEAQWSRV